MPLTSVTLDVTNEGQFVVEKSYASQEVYFTVFRNSKEMTEYGWLIIALSYTQDIHKTFSMCIMRRLCVCVWLCVVELGMGCGVWCVCVCVWGGGGGGVWKGWT